jgi:hypothetical protein
MCAHPHGIAEAVIRKGHRSAPERRLAGLIAGRIIERCPQAAHTNVLESCGSVGPMKAVAAADAKEHRTHLRLHTRIDDGENLRPTAVAPLAPDGRYAAAAARQHAMHLQDGALRVGRIH